MSSHWFGLTCECYLDGELIQGPVRDLSPSGFFLETMAPFEPGHEFDLCLTGGETRLPIRIHGVVEFRQDPGPLGLESQHGVRFRLSHFSHDYNQLIASERLRELATPSNDDVTEEDGERRWLLDVLAPASETQPGKNVPHRNIDSTTPEAIVIDDGELDDVVRILAELGVKTERQSPDDDTLPSDWIPPQHLLVVTAKRALKLHFSLKTKSPSYSSISVADNDARMVCSAVRQLGYNYAISRPIHPLAMSMLLRQAVFPDNENRAVPREILGCSVSWWRGWGRKRPGTILDISQVGCQLLVGQDAAPGSGIKVRLPDGIADGRAITLTGEVIWSARETSGTMLGVTFEKPSDQVLERLKQILALPGPCRLSGEPRLLEDSGIKADGAKSKELKDEGPKVEDTTAAKPKPEPPQPEATPGDRRRGVRAAIRQEVVALDHDSNQVKHLLVSSDLTVVGMRVEDHPSLALGDQMVLALYENSEGGPLILSAEVARDDGRLGWWIRFTDVTPELRERLSEALNRFPPVTRLDSPDPESGRIILAHVVDLGPTT